VIAIREGDTPRYTHRVSRLPKPPSQRRRQNRIAGERVIPADAKREAMPELVGDYTDETRRWWQQVWKSPIATMYLDCDTPGLELIAMLVDRVNRGTASAALLGELRQREDRYGLNPLSRRRLGWEIRPALPGDAPEAGDRAATDARWLRVVDPV
jgi:hypothetical protein